MEKNIRLLIIWSIISIIPLFSSCENEDEINEWSANYVYLQKENHFAPIGVFSLSHNPEGIHGDEVTSNFHAKMREPIADDVYIRLAVESADIPIEKIKISKLNVVIPAGKIESEEVTVEVADWEFAESDKDSKDYKFRVVIESIQTTEKNILISEPQKELVIPTSKMAYSPIINTKPENWVALDRSGWNTSSTETYYSFWGPNYKPEYAIDGNMGSVWFAYARNYRSNKDKKCWWKAVLDTPSRIHGFSITKQSAQGPAYNVKQAIVQYKREGDELWANVGVELNFGEFDGDNPQYVLFNSPLEGVKEFKIEILEPSANSTGFSELNLYADSKSN